MGREDEYFWKTAKERKGTVNANGFSVDEDVMDMYKSQDRPLDTQ